MSQEITASQVNALRKRTGAGLMDCKVALVEANGDTEEAITILKKKGIAKAAKKAEREAAEGLVHSYIHLGGRVGVMLELNCETDFVARNDEFRELASDIALHIAAASPLYVDKEDVPEALVAKERDIACSQVEGKPAEAAQKIIDGKVSKFYQEVCLLDQPFIKDDRKTVRDLIAEKISTIGENIVMRRFVRYQIGLE